MRPRCPGGTGTAASCSCRSTGCRGNSCGEPGPCLQLCRPPRRSTSLGVLPRNTSRRDPVTISKAQELPGREYAALSRPRAGRAPWVPAGGTVVSRERDVNNGNGSAGMARGQLVLPRAGGGWDSPGQTDRHSAPAGQLQECGAGAPWVTPCHTHHTSLRRRTTVPWQQPPCGEIPQLQKQRGGPGGNRGDEEESKKRK